MREVQAVFLTLADMHFHLQVLWIGEIAAISALLARLRRKGYFWIVER